MRRIVVLFGAPGIGKGTVGASLSRKWGMPLVSIGDLLRVQVKSRTALGIRADNYMKKGELVPDSLVLEALSGRIKEEDASSGFILDGFPRNPVQAEMLEGIFVPEDECVVLYLEGSDSLLMDRLSNRRICGACGAIFHLKHMPSAKEGVCDKCGGVLIQREDDKPDVISRRLEVFSRMTMPILEYYRGKHSVVPVCAEGDLFRTLDLIDGAGLWR